MDRGPRWIVVTVIFNFKTTQSGENLDEKPGGNHRYCRSVTVVHGSQIVLKKSNIQFLQLPSLKMQ